jgi:hypothetical protein
MTGWAFVRHLNAGIFRCRRPSKTVHNISDPDFNREKVVVNLSSQYMYTDGEPSETPLTCIQLPRKSIVRSLEEKQRTSAIVIKARVRIFM